jgi:hypothetical protein
MSASHFRADIFSEVVILNPGVDYALNQKKKIGELSRRSKNATSGQAF